MVKPAGTVDVVTSLLIKCIAALPKRQYLTGAGSFPVYSIQPLLSSVSSVSLTLTIETLAHP